MKQQAIFITFVDRIDDFAYYVPTVGTRTYLHKFGIQ